MDPSILRAYALSMIGKPYFWSGDDPVSGFDCSGLVSELLRAAGVVPNSYRDTAQGLYTKFSADGDVNRWAFGSLAFYGKDWNSITHVGFALDSYCMIEAGGGNSETTTEATASTRNAFVRIRAIKYRKDFLGVVRPRYPIVPAL